MKNIVMEARYGKGPLPKFEAAIFADGMVAIHWMGDHKSTEIWNSWSDVIAEYGADYIQETK